MIDTLAYRPLMTMYLDVAYARARIVGDVPAGRRGMFPVDGGRFEGDRLRGTVLGDGADWVTWRPDGAMVIDVRLMLLTHDDALIAMHYVGLLCARTPDAQAALQRREVIAYEDSYIRTTPRFETSDPRYAWLNRVIAVANGHRAVEGPMYQVFEIE
ncbi:DUF3237 domain-containing protein [Sphingomonas sp. GB1N7]|uniref:DUF3237 domain-containing protein n=1 Tax=Parasphingomonas caseinilytica TaxID=3096158 RepID=UPI002FC8D83B